MNEQLHVLYRQYREEYLAETAHDLAADALHKAKGNARELFAHFVGA